MEILLLQALKSMHAQFVGIQQVINALHGIKIPIQTALKP